MPRARNLMGPLCAAALILAAVPAAAPAKAKTQVFKMDLKVNVDTEWRSYGSNMWCSDREKVLYGEGSQLLQLKVRKRLVTLRKGRLAFPGTKGTMKLAGTTFFPLNGLVIRKAEYDLKWVGRGDTCAPGNNGGGEKPSTAKCGRRKARGGQYTFLPSGKGLKLTALTLLDDPFGGECPAESNSAVTLPTDEIEITHGKDALKQLANPRKKKVFVQGMTAVDGLKTDEPWGMGEEHWGEQTTDVLWYATFRRVK